jgi:sugar lactone lactonase YvrE
VPEALRTRAPDFGAFGAGDWSRQASTLAEIKRLVDSGSKISAIKLYRETFGVGLKEAKDAVEAIEHGHNVQMAQVSFGSPQTIGINTHAGDFQVTTTPGGRVQVSRRAGGGCTTAIVVIVVLLVVVSIVVPILLSVGALAMFVPGIEQRTDIVALATAVRASPTARPSATARPSPTPQFANVVSEFGGKGTGAGKMEDARALTVDHNGNVFVGEYLGGRVQVFGTDGKFKTQCLLDPKMPLPSMAADRRGNLFVLQAITVTQYDAATCEVRNVFQPALGESYEHIAVGADGVLYATMTGNQKDRVVRFDADGQISLAVADAISGQTGDFELDPLLAVDGQGNFYVLGRFASRVFKFDRTGRFVNTIGSRGNEPGQFSAVNAIAVDSQGRIYVSDSKGVQVFAPDGRYLDVFDIPQGVASGMAFDDDDNLWITARERVYQLKLGKE